MVSELADREQLLGARGSVDELPECVRTAEDGRGDAAARLRAHPLRQRVMRVDRDRRGKLVLSGYLADDGVPPVAGRSGAQRRRDGRLPGPALARHVHEIPLEDLAHGGATGLNGGDGHEATLDRVPVTRIRRGCEFRLRTTH
jgi:hypothetical protein